jgi:hypothetical protein
MAESKPHRTNARYCFQVKDQHTAQAKGDAEGEEARLGG